MNTKILIGVAWPYANSPLHLGHLAGAYLPPDIFARYHRLRGNDVLMVSGSDTHGTPITVTAEQLGVRPEEVVHRYHTSFVESLQGLGVSFDLFTHTNTENHWAVTTDLFLRLLERKYIYKATMQALYCPVDKRFLPDRYVEGTCPFCGYEDARGDQCDRCGKPLDALELIAPRCKFCGATPEVRETEHFFLDLEKFNEPLKEWVADKDYWRPNVRNFTTNLLREGLHGRAISRDIDWGIPIPVEGYADKRIYVWFDAVIGYLSAAIEWAYNRGTPEAWHQWWDAEAESRSYYFVGKDNIFFHTLIWPAMLMGYGGLQLPHDVPANEYLTLEGHKISSSRNWAVWAPDYLARYDPDPLRYTLTVHAPETSDSDFSWQDFLDRNNNELVGTWGNLAHRMLTFAGKHYQGAVPTPGELGDADREILRTADDAFAPVAEDLEASLPRRHRQGDGCGARGQPLPGRRGALEGAQERARARRHRHLRGAARHRLAQGALCTLPPLLVAKAARVPGVRQQHPGRAEGGRFPGERPHTRGAHLRAHPGGRPVGAQPAPASRRCASRSLLSQARRIDRVEEEIARLHQAAAE